MNSLCPDFHDYRHANYKDTHLKFGSLHNTERKEICGCAAAFLPEIVTGTCIQQDSQVALLRVTGRPASSFQMM